MKIKQDHIRRVLDSKKIPYTEIDVAAPHQLDEKVFMQKTLQLNEDDLVALPPQIFNNNKYRGVRTPTTGGASFWGRGRFSTT